MVFSDLPVSETRGLPANVISLPLGVPGGALHEDLYSPIPLIVPGQLFCAELAMTKGLNPDSPRGLSKVTLTM